MRTSAVFWLGQIGGETAFLADLVRNDNESREVRKQAAFSIGVGKDRAALSTLQDLYPSIADCEMKNQIIFYGDSEARRLCHQPATQGRGGPDSENAARYHSRY